MGCVHSGEPRLVKIQLKEKKLGISNYTVSQIKQAFFNLNNQNEIEEGKIYKALDNLKLEITSENKERVWGPFLKVFLNQNISLVDSRNLMAVFFILSKSNIQEKAKAVFRLYDYANNNELSKKELEFMLENVISSVENYGKVFCEDYSDFSKMRESSQRLEQSDSYQENYLGDIKKKENAFKQEQNVVFYNLLIID